MRRLLILAAAWLLAGCVVRVDLDSGPGTRSVQSFDAGTSEDLLAVHACGPDDVWIAGTLGTVLRVRDTTVEAVPTPTRFDLRAILCHEDRVWAAGDRGTLLSWDGDAWDDWTGGPVDISGDPLDYVGLAEHHGDVWLLPSGTAYDEEFRAVALRFDGARWFTTTRFWGSSYDGNTIAAGGAGLYVFHDDGQYGVWNGASWDRRLIPLSNAERYDLQAAAVDDDAAYVVGSDDEGEATVLRVAGTWDVVAAGVFGLFEELTAIVRLDGRSIVGTSFGNLLVVDDDGAVTPVARTGRRIHALAASEDAVWAVGADGLIVRIAIAD